MNHIFRKVLCLITVLCLFILASCETNTLPKLSAPVLSMEDTVLSWTQVEGAVGYTVYQNGSVIENKLTVTTLDVAAKVKEEGDHLFTVKAEADTTVNRDSDKSNEVTYTVKVAKSLTKPVATLVNGVLSWAKVEGASSYTVYVNDNVFKENYKELSLDLTKAITEYGTYNVQVKAVGDQVNYKDSTLSAKLVYEFIETVPGNFEFASADFIYDGEEKALVVTGDPVPAGYTLSYENNNQKEQGKYQVTANFKNAKGEVILALHAILTIDNPKNEAFETWTDELLVALFEEDQMSVNFFFNNPATYNIPHYKAELSRAYFGDYEESMKDIYDLLNEMEAFEYKTFSFEEKDTYDIIYSYFEYISNITENMNYMTNGYLGSYLGYQCNLPLELAEYKFRNVQDIEDWIAYCNDAEEAFKNYYEFTVKQAEKGYAMPDYVIDNVVEQCENFVNESENHYLISIFNDKVSEVTFIDDTAKETYKAQALQAIQGPLTNAYKYIQTNLPSQKGKATVYGGLALYEGGTDYYELMLQDETGYANLTGEEAIKYVDMKLAEIDKNISYTIAVYNRLSSTEGAKFYSAAVEGKPYFSELEPAELLASFRTLASAFVPELEEMPNVNIKLVPESLQDSYSPAAYYVSPIDETNNESIYLNPKYLDDKNYIYTTLAHEGYPGHLYQNVYTKSLDINDVRKVVRCSGYMEGWATYMEMNSYSFVPNYTSEGLKLALKYLRYNDIYNGLISARFDLGVHFEGWTAQDMADYTNELLGYTPEDEYYYTAETIKANFDQVTEIPTNSIKYFFTYCKLDDMHTNAKTQLGDLFNEVEFNAVLLNYGAMPLGMLEEKVNEYISDVLFVNGK